MSLLTLTSIFLLTFSFISLWIRRDPKIWGGLLSLSVLCNLIDGNLLWPGLLSLTGLTVLWCFYAKKPNLVLFITLTVATLGFKLGFFPGFSRIFFTPKFQINFSSAIIGLLPLALIVPLSQTAQDGRKILKGLAWGCGGIGVLAILATLAGVAQWNFKLPSFMLARTWGNLFLASIPEEAFYRGFLQRGLGNYFGYTKKGNAAALFLTTILFTFAHIYWTPDAALLGFVFLAGLLYGGVYLLSEKIESAILCHFLLNLIHMTFFEYHAM